MGTSVMGRIGLGGSTAMWWDGIYYYAFFVVVAVLSCHFFFKQKACPELKGEFRDKLACDCLI